MANRITILLVCVIAMAAGLVGCDLFGSGGKGSGGGDTGGGVLPAPTGVMATQNVYFDTVLVGWNAVTGAAKYQVSRSDSASGPFTAIGTTSSGTAIANTTTVPSSYPITKGKHYFYQIAAVDSGSVVGTASVVAEGWSNTYLFNDSFEDGDYKYFPTWGYRGTGGTAWQITSPGANSTYYALSYTGGSGNGYWTQMSSGIKPTYISFWAKVSTTSVANTGEFMCGDSSSYNYLSILFYFYSDGKMYVEDLNYTMRGGTAYSANTWYHIEFTNINWTAHTYDFLVNGTSRATGVTMWDAAPSNIATVDLFNYSGSAQAWWDEIVMY